MAKAFVNEAGIRELLVPGGMVARDLERRAIRVQNRARTGASGVLVKVQTGRYRSSILAGTAVPDAVHGLRVSIGSNMEYAIYIELGTRAHPISPRQKKALWWGNKKNTFMRTAAVENASRGKYSGLPLPIFGSVTHPGNTARRVLEQALSAAGG